MNKKLALLATLPALLLSSCSFFQFFESDEKTVDLYVLDMIATDINPKLDDAYISRVDLRFKNGEKYVPYISLKQYANIFKKFLNPKVVSEVVTEGFATSWKIELDNSLLFYAVISPTEKQVLVAGDLTSALKSGEDGIQPTYDVLNYGAKMNASFEQVGKNNYATYTFEDCDFGYFRDGGELYMPLGLLDLALSEATTLYVTYNYAPLMVLLCLIT